MAGRNLFAEGAIQPPSDAEEGQALFTGAQAEEPAVATVARQAVTEQPAEELPEGTALDVVLEPLQAIGSGLLGTIGGGVAGAVSAPFVGAEEAAGIVTGAQEKAAEFGAPETQRGQEALQTLGDIIEKGIDIARFPISGLAGLAELLSGQGAEQAAQTVESVQEIGVGKTAGNRAFEITGDPLISAVAETSPEIVGSLIPITKMAKTRSALKAKIAEQIKAGGTNKKLADYMINGAGKVKTDKLAQETVKQGFDQSVIAAVKGASKVDRTKMSKMVEVMQKGKENALFAMKNRPSDVAGNSLLDRVNHIKTVNREAGKQIDDVAKSLRGQSVDSTKAVDNFMGNLDEMGIRLDNRLRPNFKGSDIEGLAGPKLAIANMIKRMASGKRGAAPDAHELHRMKRFIDEQVTYGKSGEGLKGKTERVLKQLRSDLDATLDDAFPEYNNVNTRYADTVGALDALQDVAGKKMDLFGANAEKATGTLLRRMMSNAHSRVNLVDAVDNLDTISRKYGGVFDDDIATQMLFVDELDSVFGPVARTSLAGETAKGFKKGAEAAAGQRTAVGAAIEVGAAGIEKLRGISQENAFKTITELLKRE